MNRYVCIMGGRKRKRQTECEVRTDTSIIRINGNAEIKKNAQGKATRHLFSNFEKRGIGVSFPNSLILRGGVVRYTYTIGELVA